MKIKVGLEDGYLADKFTKYASNEFKDSDDKPILSFPMQVSEIPDGARYLALSFIDHDAVAVVGFSWIHWLVANIPTNSKSEVNLPEDFSRDPSLGVVQGENSNAKSPANGAKDSLTNWHYSGPQPPDRDHDYTLTVYALSDKLELNDRFLFNEFRQKVRQKTIGVTEINVKARV